MAVQIQVRRDTAAAWAAANPTLAQGEFGLATDTMVLKVGDGIRAYNSLPNILAGATVGDGDKGDIVVSASGTVWNIDSAWTGGTGITTLGTITTGTWSATAISAEKGGTGLTSYAAGDLLYASGTTALSKLGIGATNAVLTAGSTAPQWSTSLTLAGVTADAQVLSSSGVITDSSTSRTLSATDNGKVIRFTSSSSITLNCATGLAAGFACTIIQAGSGQITVAPNGATLVSRGSAYKTAGQYAMAMLISDASNQFTLGGDITS